MAGTTLPGIVIPITIIKKGVEKELKSVEKTIKKTGKTVEKSNEKTSKSMKEFSEDTRKASKNLKHLETTLKEYYSMQRRGVKISSESHKAMKKLEEKYNKNGRHVDRLSGKLKKQEQEQKKLNAAKKKAAKMYSHLGHAMNKEQKGVAALHQQISRYHQLQKKGVTLTKKQRAEVKRLTHRYKMLGGETKQLSGHHASLLTRLTKARWLFVNVMMALAALMGTYRVIIQPIVEFEDELKDVQKTTGYTGDQIENLEGSLLSLSKSVPVAATELAKISAVAGQLGIGTQGIAAIKTFTETAAMMSVATEMTAEDSATYLAKISQAFNLPISNINNLGASINELSNTTAASASDIVASVRRVGGSAEQLGLSVALINATQATLVASGMQASRAGTRMRRAITEIANNVEGFSNLLGITSEQLTKQLGEDANKVFMDILTSLKDMNSATERSIIISKLFGETGGNAVRTLITSYDELQENIKSSSDEMASGLSLIKETAIKLNSISGKWKTIKNEIQSIYLGRTGPIETFTDPFYRNKVASGILRRRKELEETGKLDWESSPLLGASRGGSIHLILDEMDRLTAKLKNIYGAQSDVFKQIDEEARSVEYLSGQLFVYEKALKQAKLQSDTLLESLKKSLSELGRSPLLYNDAKSAIKKATQELIFSGDITDETRERLIKLNNEVKNFIDLRDYSPGPIPIIVEFQKQLDEIKGLDATGDKLAKLYAELFNVTPTQEDLNLAMVTDAFSQLDSEIAKQEQKIFDRETRIARLWTTDFMSPIIKREISKLNAELFNIKVPERKIGGKTEVEYINTIREAAEELRKLNKQSRMVNELTRSLRFSIRHTNAAYTDANSILDDYEEQLSKVEKRISSLIKSRFRDETAVDKLISKTEQHIRLQELEGMGITDPYVWLQEQLNNTTNDYEQLIGEMDKVTQKANEQQTAFEAWRESIKEFIRGSIEAGRDLGKNISETVKRFQTKYMGISQISGTTGGAQGGSAAEKYLDMLGLAKSATFGYGHEKVDLYAQTYEDSLQDLAKGSDSVIDSLGVEYSARDTLLSKISTQETIVNGLNDKLTTFKNAMSDINLLTTDYKEGFISYNELMNKAGEKLKESYNISTASGGGGGGSYQYTPTTESNVQDKVKDLESGGWYFSDKFKSKLGMSSFQSGGVVSRPTLSLLGERGPERVTPLRGGNTGGSVQIGQININTQNPNSRDYNRKVYNAASKFLNEITK